MILNNISKCHFNRVPQLLVPLWKSATMTGATLKECHNENPPIEGIEILYKSEFKSLLYLLLLLPMMLNKEFNVSKIISAPSKPPVFWLDWVHRKFDRKGRYIIITQGNTSPHSLSDAYTNMWTCFLLVILVSQGNLHKLVNGCHWSH